MQNHVLARDLQLDWNNRYFKPLLRTRTPYLSCMSVFSMSHLRTWNTDASAKISQHSTPSCDRMYGVRSKLHGRTCIWYRVDFKIGDRYQYCRILFLIPRDFLYRTVIHSATLEFIDVLFSLQVTSERLNWYAFIPASLMLDWSPSTVYLNNAILLLLLVAPALQLKTIKECFLQLDSSATCCRLQKTYVLLW